MDVLDKSYLDWVSKNTENGKKLFYVEGSDSKDLSCGLEELFKIVDDYAKEHYYFNVEDYGNVYNISDRNNYYTLSLLQGPTSAYSLKRDKDKTSYIDVKDIKNNVVRGRENLEVLNRMKAISLHLKELSKLGVPMDLVERETSKEIRLLKTKNNR